MPRKGWKKSKATAEAAVDESLTAASAKVSRETDTKLAQLKLAETVARESYFHWVGRSHPNSIKMAQLKAQHHKAMMELISYQDEIGLTDRPSALPKAGIPEDFIYPETGVVAYDPGHRVQSIRPHKPENVRSGTLTEDVKPTDEQEPV